jgi:hypothetical protein
VKIPPRGNFSDWKKASAPNEIPGSADDAAVIAFLKSRLKL